MDNLIVLLVVAVVVGLAARYVYKAKKKGQKCIGCPHAGSCSAANGAAGGCSGCGQ